MILFTNGDSYTYGYELIDKNDSWPYVLGNLLNIKNDHIINMGICSASNEYIMRTTNDFLLDSEIDVNNLLVVIGWTSDIRWEGFLDDYNSFVQLKLGREIRLVDEENRCIIRGSELKNKITKNKLNLYNNISQDFLSTYKKSLVYNNIIKYYNIYNMHCTLKSLNIKHLFFNSLTEYSKIKHKMVIPKADELLTRKNMLINVEKIKKILIKDKCWINDYTMEEFCKPYPKGEIEQHPLEDGHKAWTNHVLSYLKGDTTYETI